VAPAAANRSPIALERRSVIRNAQLTVRVEDVEKAEKRVNATVARIGGYVDSASSSDLDSDHPSMAIKLRVPVNAFDDAIAGFETLGARMSKTVSSEDVTAQLVDLDARVKTLRTQEETYLGILKNTHNLDGVFSLQQQLTAVRTEIESIAAQRKALGGLASLSTIDLTLEQRAAANAPAKDPNWLAQSWGEATSGMGTVMRSATAYAIWILVFSPLWIPVFLVGRKVLKSALKRESGLEVNPRTF